MNVTEAIRARRSIRKFRSGFSLPAEHLHAILEAGMMAPSACNCRPWTFTVLQSEEAKQKMIALHPYAGHLRNASIGILVCADESAETGIAEGYFPQDCGAAVENMLLQSLELGYGSCWCGIYPRTERAAQIRQAFSLSATPIALVIIGKADEAPAARGFYEEKKVTVL